MRNEIEWSHYNFEQINSAMWLKHFEDYEREAKRLIALKLPIPAYDFVIKASHAFNMLDARGVISVSERASYIANIRDIARVVAEGYLESRKAQGYPLIAKLASHESVQEIVNDASTQAPAITNGNFLLEIGSEELPASFVPIGSESLKREMTKLLQDEGIKYQSLSVMGTPRRLAVAVQGMHAAKSELSVEKKGPSKEHSFHPDGTLKPAGEGFFRAICHAPLTLSQIESGAFPDILFRDIKGTSYLFANYREPAVQTFDILKEKLSELILKIDFPKKMRWADLDISYARPIRWIVALFDTSVVPFSVGPIQSGNISSGHRQINPGPIVIESAASYKKQLEARHVLVDIKERSQKISDELQKLEQELDIEVVQKEKVIPQVLHLVEWPFLTITEFNADFLKAPKEVLISEMVEHQKYFPVADKKGVLKNQFIITANTKPTDSIRHGNRKVISARLSDGVFLYEQDLKIPLVDFNEKLKGVIFQKGLGTMYDKVLRLEKLVKILATYIPCDHLPLLIETATLCKADLATEMVGEFPELQGQMGRIYAEKQGKPQALALGIDEHWMPRGEGAPLPTTAIGILLSIADKIDNLLGFFALNLKPTSSSDPYALRRQALGLIRIVIQNKIQLPLTSVLEECLKVFPEEQQRNGKNLISEITTFLVGRAKSVLHDSSTPQCSFPRGEIEACLSVRSDDFYDVFERLRALHALRKKEGNSTFGKLLEVHKRCQGQINGVQKLSFSQSLLTEKEEKSLYEAFKARLPVFEKAVGERNYSDALKLLSELQPELATLFEHVKILADDEKLKTNRLAFLQMVAGLFALIADFQKILEKET